MDLLNELSNLTKQLSNSLKQLRTNGIKLAEAEKEYKIAVNKKALLLRSEDMPVTLISQVIYRANQEAINTLKLQIRIIESQIQREYGSNETI